MRLWMPQVFALLSDSDANDGICEHIVQPEISKFDFTNHTDDNVCQVVSNPYSKACPIISTTKSFSNRTQREGIKYRLLVVVFNFPEKGF